jgi:hypothetical protein
VALLDALLAVEGGGGGDGVDGDDDASADDDGVAWAAWAAVYCAAYERLDDAWVAGAASYMAFPAIAAGVREEVEAALAARPASVRQVRARLGLS